MDDDGLMRCPSQGRAFLHWLDYLRHLWSSFGRIRGYITLDELCARAREGDILTFRGSGLVAGIQEFATCSPVSHVAQVARVDGILGYFEADRHRVPKGVVREGSCYTGVRFVELRAGIEFYLNHMGIEVNLRPLILNVQNEGTLRAYINQKIIEVAREYEERRAEFTSDVVVFAAISYPWAGRIASLLRWLATIQYGEDAYQRTLDYHEAKGVWCSRLVSEFMTRAGLFEPVEGAAHGLLPVHFTRTNDPPLPWRGKTPRVSALPWKNLQQGVYGLGEPVTVR